MAKKVHIYIYMNVAFMACTCAGCNPSNIMWNIYLKKYDSFLIKKRLLFGHWPFEKIRRTVFEGLPKKQTERFRMIK